MWEDEAIANRLLYKEKPPLKALTQKCLMIAKTTKEHHAQLFSEIEDELEGVEYSLDKQHLHMKASRRDHAAFLNQIKVFEEERANLASSLEGLKQELSEAEEAKANILEYEDKARQINCLPGQAALQKSKAAVEIELVSAQAEIAAKEELWDRARKKVTAAAGALRELSDDWT